MGLTTWAQNYPVKPVRYVIPFPAGTGNDIVGRLLTDCLTQLAAYAKANPGKLSYTSGLVGTSP